VCSGMTVLDKMLCDGEASCPLRPTSAQMANTVAARNERLHHIGQTERQTADSESRIRVRTATSHRGCGFGLTKRPRLDVRTRRDKRRPRIAASREIRQFANNSVLHASEARACLRDEHCNGWRSSTQWLNSTPGGQTGPRVSSLEILVHLRRDPQPLTSFPGDCACDWPGFMRACFCAVE
jgi:hypothetical protein